ncbi:hypothetical protein JCM8097_004679, partial [Rhodosporidiobolus ruineniae]
LALRHHPDKGGDAEAFQKISAAYEVLGDERRKERYDAGEESDDFDDFPPGFTAADYLFSHIFGGGGFFFGVPRGAGGSSRGGSGAAGRGDARGGSARGRGRGRGM